jgi:8-oxo-dGTP pyrophosphatase MutT (NUDIX family)
MDQILRGEAGWEARIAEAVRNVPRPIQVDPRFTPRRLSSSQRLPAYDPRAQPGSRPAATLLLVYPDAAGTLSIPLTVRQAELRDHAGEVSLPGGAVEPDDASQEAAALREAWEEIGVEREAVRIAGHLDDVWIPVSNFTLRPFVGTLAAQPSLRPHTDEVAAIVELPLSLLLEDQAITEELIEGPGWELRAGVYRYGETRIWGATARTLAMFATALRRES